MDLNTTFDAREALNLMRQGLVLRQQDARGLFQQKKDGIAVVYPSCALKLKEEDFLELYTQNRFLLYQYDGQIDEKKDQEYYLWRETKQ